MTVADDGNRVASILHVSQAENQYVLIAQVYLSSSSSFMKLVGSE